MIGKVISWFKELFLIVKTFKTQLENFERRTHMLHSDIEECRKIIKDRTDLHADIHYKSSSCIIAVGRYRNRDYVQVFNLRDEDFKGMIERFREMERYGHMARIDAPPQMKAVFEHEFYRLK
jgi:23S rRNA A2030 N6-methylase RlmJ